MGPIAARRSPLLLALASVAMVACGSVSGGATSVDVGSADAGPAPQLVMTGPGNGWLVWNRGGATVVLATADGFHTLTNATPPAVPTDGGLVLARDGRRFLAGVAPSGRLSASPFLMGDGSRAGWTGGELPGAITARADAVALQGSTLWAVVGAGAASRLVSSPDTGVSWRVRATAKALDPAGHLALTGILWSDAEHGWLSAIATSGHRVLFAATGAGSAWVPVPLPATVAPASAAETWASVPCGSGKTLTGLVVSRPVSGPGQAVVVRSSDSGNTWNSGVAVPVPGGQPVLSCRPGELWLAVGGPASSRLLVSTDEGVSWRQAGTPPGVVSALAVSAPGAGYAVTGVGADEILWAVSRGGSVFTRLPLPAWVAKLTAGGAS